MSIDLQGLSATELKSLIASAQDRLIKGERERIKAAREKIQQLLKEEGLSLEQVFGGGKRSTASVGSVPPKYAHPDDPGVTWSGRGMHPKWFKEALAKGRTAEDLLVTASSSTTGHQLEVSKPAARKRLAEPAPRKSVGKTTSRRSANSK